MLTHPTQPLLLLRCGNFFCVSLTGSQGDQPLAVGIGDSDNSLRMLWAKLSLHSCMDHADDAEMESTLQLLASSSAKRTIRQAQGGP